MGSPTSGYGLVEQVPTPWVVLGVVGGAQWGPPKTAILAECRAWVAESQDPGRKATMGRLVKELELELGRLGRDVE
jgi:hypothetical protein